MEDHRLDPLGQSVFGIGERRERTAAGSVAGLDRNAAGVSNRVMPERIEIVEGEDGFYDVLGSTEIDKIERIFDLDLEDDDFSTIAGMITSENNAG